MSASLSSSRLNGRKASQAPNIQPTTFYVPNNATQIISQSETPPLSITSQNASGIKYALYDYVN